MKIINEVKYYVKVIDTPRLAIKVFQTEDNKFHRFISVISNKVSTETKQIHTKNNGLKTVNCIVSPKKLVTKFLNEYANAWINNDFKSELSQKFNKNMTEDIMKIFIFAYGVRALNQIEPVRYNQDVKLTDWEFRMFYKPRDIS